MKKIRFIINPHSGSKGKAAFPDLIEKNIDHARFESDICFTKAPHHATELAREASANKYDIVVAVGGDGSANEVGAGLIGTETALGIIPTGSGNGMSRHLKIPMEFQEAVKLFNNYRIERIDTLDANGRFCIGTIGIGFDAHIAHLFSKAGKRGYSTYVKLVLTEFSSYKTHDFHIVADGNAFDKSCFLLTFANSSQFGNNAVIAPFADVKDGWLDISMMKSFPVLAAPHLIYRLMNNNIHMSKYFEKMRGKNVVVSTGEKTITGHIDGEPVIFEDEVKINVHPLSLNVVVPETE
jgi:diacylglycerol kinase (ATP)